LILSEALVDALIALDARYVFGVSGANIEHLHDAIHRCGRGKLKAVLARSEFSAAFMADARARVHRTLGVCCSTSGGGMMNLSVGIAEAYSDSVPVLAIVGQPPTNVEGRGAFQDSSGIGRSVNGVDVFRSMTKYTAKVTPEEFWTQLQEAVVVALSGRPGPAALLVPRNAWTTEVEDPDPDFVEEIRSMVKPPPPTEEAGHHLLRELRQARHPVLVLGPGVRRGSDPEAVARFAKAARIPVITTICARGEFDNDDPLYLGTLGVAGHPSVHAYLRERADLLLVVGAGLNTMTRAPFARDPVDLPQKRVIAVNIDGASLWRVLDPGRQNPGAERSFWPQQRNPLSFVVEADSGEVFQLLHDLWSDDPFDAGGAEGYQRTYFEPEVAEQPPPSAPRGKLLQSDALAILQHQLPQEGHYVFDAGNCAAAALHLLDIPRGATSTIALGMGGMGWAIGGGVGAQLGSPAGTNTVVFTGDGSFMIAGLEVHTAVDLGLPVLFVVFNNNMHGMCVIRQHLFFDSRIEAVSYAPIDVATVARGLGDETRLWVGRATNPHELSQAIVDYMHSHRHKPGVLELVLGDEEVPPFVPFLPSQPRVTGRIQPSVSPPASSDPPPPGEDEDG
jgi:acetolactate synthase-1/2/3 large subunit